MNSGPQISPTSYFPLGNLAGGGSGSNLERARGGKRGTILCAVSHCSVNHCGKMWSKKMFK